MSNVVYNIGALSEGIEEELIDVNVASDSMEHMRSLQAETNQNRTSTFLTYDPIATAQLRPYFDGYVTAPTGLYQRQTFITTSRSVELISQFVGFVIEKHDEDIKLLYMVQKYEQPQYIHTELPPVQFSIRYAILKR